MAATIQNQVRLPFPVAFGVVLQGMVLVPMLAGVLFTEYRLRIVHRERLAPATPVAEVQP